MLSTVNLVPGMNRHLPRSGPSAGPSSRREVALQAEVTHLAARLVEMEREQHLQFKRIAQIQQELDEIKGLIKNLAQR